MKILSLILLLSAFTFGQSGKSVLTDAQKDSIGVMIRDSSNTFINDSLNQLKIDYRLSLNNALLYDVTMDSNGDSVYGHWVFDTEFADYYDIDSVGYDLSGNGNNLTSNFSPEYKMIGESPVYAGGKAVLMDGTTNSFYVPAADASDFEVGRNNFTLEAWVNTSSTERQYILSKHLALQNYFFRIRDVVGTPMLKLTSTNSEEIYSTVNISDGEWHYLVAVIDFDNDSVHIFIDGIDRTTTPYDISDITAIDASTANFCVGAIEVATDPINGLIAEARFSKRALTSTEIYNYYKKSQHLYQKVYSPLTEAYKLRVLKDGGVIGSIHAVEEVYNLGLDLDSLKFWGGVQFGVKYDANNKVTKLYDLSNNENDLVQTDTSKAFTYAVNGMTSDTARYMTVAFADTIAQPNLTIMLAKQDNAYNSNWIDGITSDLRHNIETSSDIQFFSGTLRIYSGEPSNVFSVVSVRWDSDDSLFVNSVFDTSGNTGSQSLSGITLGAEYDFSQTFRGTIREVIISNDATKRTIIENSINGRWDIY